MQVKAYKTHVVTPNESLFDIIKRYIPSVQERSVIAITSKILSFCQNRIIPKHQVPDKLDLIKQEADLYLDGDYREKYGVCLTIKDNLLIPTAGIDESNSDDQYVLYPVNINRVLDELWQNVRDFYGCAELGILLTDSHTTPLRRGVTGIALGWCGFKPLYNYIGTPDIHGRLLKCTQINVVDSLATAAVFCMGEGNEQTPLAVIENLEKVVFEKSTPKEQEREELKISLEEDLYSPLLNHVGWQSSRGFI